MHNTSHTIDCKDPRKTMKQLLSLRSKEMLAWRESYPYPQNLLREAIKTFHIPLDMCQLYIFFHFCKIKSVALSLDPYPIRNVQNSLYEVQ